MFVTRKARKYFPPRVFSEAVTAIGGAVCAFAALAYALAQIWSGFSVLARSDIANTNNKMQTHVFTPNETEISCGGRESARPAVEVV